MKARLMLVLLSLIICLSAVACNPLDKNAETTSDETPVVTPQETPEPETPAEEFETKENVDGTLTIKKYLGDDMRVIIPKTIDGKTVTVIGPSIFNTRNIEYVKLPDSVTIIQRNAFQHVNKLKTVILSKNLDTIGSYAFDGCTALEDVILPESLTTIGSYAFQKCTSLKHIRIPTNAMSAEVSGEAAFLESGLETVEIAEGVEKIAYAMFAKTKLKSVTLPSSVRMIDYQAFTGCFELSDIKLNNGLDTVATNAFSQTSIEEIIIPASVSDIKEDAFFGCSMLKSVKFGGNAPGVYDVDPLSSFYEKLDYTVCYHEGAEGFTSGEWCGFKTEIW